MNIVDDLNPGFCFRNIAIVATTTLPEVSHDEALVLGTARWALFDRLENLGHIIVLG